MVKHFAVWVIVALLSLTSATPSQANEYLTGSVGYFDLIDKDNQATQLGLEYRFNSWVYRLRPMVGVMVMTDENVYGYAGFNMDIPLVQNQLYLIPNLAAGAYRKGDGKDLGGAIEFRSGIELAYQRPNYDRIGIAFNHISNASLYSKNPGVETLMLNYSIPSSRIFGGSNH